MNKLNLPLGISDFKTIVTGNFFYIDKTIFIKEYIDNGEGVTLITRPRRWGKTLNLSMMNYFFSSKVGYQPTSGLFDGLMISKLDEGSYIKNHQGKYPVISMSFKNIKSNYFQEILDSVHVLMKDLIIDHSYVLNSQKVDPANINFLKDVLEKKINKADLESSIFKLTECLYMHHCEKVIILIDEYDTVLNDSYGKSYFEDLNNFFRNIFTSVLKDNIYIKYGLITGILKLSQNSVFSGLNNLSFYTVLDPEFGSYFGFTESEVLDLLKKLSLKSLFNDFKSWYKGFKVDQFVMYNPWSILGSLKKKGTFKVFWVNTGDNKLIENKLILSKAFVKSQLIKLMKKETITASIDENLSFNILNDTDDSFWNLLLFTGYLTYESIEYKEMKYTCELKIPNYEVFLLYSNVFSKWFTDKFENKYELDSFIKDLVNFNINSFFFFFELSNITLFRIVRMLHV